MQRAILFEDFENDFYRGFSKETIKGGGRWWRCNAGQRSSGVAREIQTINTIQAK